MDSPDQPLILTSDPEFECFLFLEGQVDFVSIDYSPLRVASDKPRRGPRHFATATSLEQIRIEIDLVLEGDGVPSPGRRTIDLALLDASKTRIQSWRAIVAVINRCRSHKLKPVVFRCRHLIEAQPKITMGSLLDQVEEHPGLVGGAIGTMLRARELESDVDKILWGRETQVWTRTRE